MNLKRFDWVIGISDVHLTGRPDLLVRKASNGTLWLLRVRRIGLPAPALHGVGNEGI